VGWSLQWSWFRKKEAISLAIVSYKHKKLEAKISLILSLKSKKQKFLAISITSNKTRGKNL
jgi:hypothetical protein